MIKLLKLDVLSDGTQRFQSQLMVGRTTADFLMRTDGVMCCYGRGDNGMDFYEYKEPYHIVLDKLEIRTQKL